MPPESGSSSFSFSYSFSAPSDSGTNKALWMMDRYATKQIDPQHFMLLHPRAQRPYVVSGATLKALSFCDRFAELDEHVQTIHANIPALPMEEIRGMLRQFIDLGLFVSADTLASRLAGANKPSRSPAPVRRVAIRTCDRPAQLKRLFKSLLDNEAVHGNRYAYVLLDDSRSQENQAENRSLVAELVRDRRLDVRYFGRQEQKRITDALAEAFVSRADTIHWLLGGEVATASDAITPGRALNLLLLTGAGEPQVLVDDDVVCDVRRPPRFTGGIEISGRVREAEFYVDRNSILSETAGESLDPFEQHGRTLGLSIAGLGQQLGEKIEGDGLKHLSAEECENLRAESRIIITRNAVFGDPGTPSNRWLYFLDPESHRSLVRTEEGYRHNTKARNAWLGFAGYRVSVNPNDLMTTTATGIDTASMVPPTFPTSGNEDLLFGTLTRFLYPDSVSLDHPWGLLHFPEPSRRWTAQHLLPTEHFNLPTLVSDILCDAPSPYYTPDPRARLQALSAKLLDFADSPFEKFRFLCRELAVAKMGDLLCAGERMLAERRDAPAYWQDDLREILETNRKPLTDPAFHKSREPDDARLHEIRSDLREFAGAVGLWADLWEFRLQHDLPVWRGD